MQFLLKKTYLFNMFKYVQHDVQHDVHKLVQRCSTRTFYWSSLKRTPRTGVSGAPTPCANRLPRSLLERLPHVAPVHPGTMDAMDAMARAFFSH